MQNRIPILVALAMGIVAAMLTGMYVDDIRANAEPKSSEVIVAARDMKPGTIIEAGDLAAAERYSAALPKFAIRWSDRNLYIGQALRMSVSDGDYVLTSYFGAETAGADRLSEKLDAAQGQRAVTIPVSNETSLEGSIRPGDRVDLLLTFQAPAGGKEGERASAAVTTVPLIEKAYVLATGTYGSKPNEPYSSLTLLVGQEEAKLLVWSKNLGELSILLRNPKDLELGNRSYVSGDVQALRALGSQELSVAAAVAAMRAVKPRSE